jgi:hypothetical protein
LPAELLRDFEREVAGVFGRRVRSQGRSKLDRLNHHHDAESQGE